jgi:protein TonB
VIGGVLGGVVGGVLGGVVGEVEAPVRAIGEIKPPRLLKQVEPIYPEIARQARVEGIVIIEAQTDIYGRVNGVKVLRSIPLLDQAAIDAVRQWVYEPMIINGRPRGVVFTVTVTFKFVK